MPAVPQKAYADWLAFVNSDPAAEDVLAYHLLDEAQARIRILQDALQKRDLTATEQEELEAYVQLDYLIQAAKLTRLEELEQQR
ncbi:MAG: hypothetical protein MUE40_10160 [Anaerolineae bacterium]|nr:hypothetical protein [Anaerolineae bacterium]